MSSDNALPLPTDAQRLARALLDIGAVQLATEKPFIWASGIESPIYCDNRLLLGYPALRQEVVRQMAGHIEYHGWKPERIAGTATAGIPHATLLADRLDLPLLYVRSQPKKHGRGQQIEGPLQTGERVVLIEDLISTGGSVLKAAEALRKAGAHVEGVLAIFSYQLPGVNRRFEEAGIALDVLTDLDTLLEVATGKGILSPERATHVKVWRDKREVS